MKKRNAAAVIVAGVTAASAYAAPRDIQFKSIDFVTSVVEVHNFGVATESLSGFRTCSHDEDQVRQYSSASAFKGLSLTAGESLFVHFNNDAAGTPDGAQRIDIAGRGNFAGPLDRGPFAIQVYFPPVAFGNGATMADFVQWSIGGIDNISADERSDEAEIGGLWTDQTLWVATTKETLSIQLLDETGGTLHSPDDYEAVEPGVALCAADCDDNGTVEFNDLICMLFEFGNTGADIRIDCDENGAVEFNDLICALFAFGPCVVK